MQPLNPGTTVKTVRTSTGDRPGWLPEALASRKWDVQGKVIKHSDGHGLCYEVAHEDGTVGWYDPDELEVLQEAISAKEILEVLALHPKILDEVRMGLVTTETPRPGHLVVDPNEYEGSQLFYIERFAARGQVKIHPLPGQGGNSHFVKSDKLVLKSIGSDYGPIIWEVT